MIEPLRKGGLLVISGSPFPLTKEAASIPESGFPPGSLLLPCRRCYFCRQAYLISQIPPLQPPVIEYFPGVCEITPGRIVTGVPKGLGDFIKIFYAIHDVPLNLPKAA